MGKEKLDFLLAQHCAPTLAGLKAASMVALPGKSMKELGEFFRSYEQCFACKGLKVMELRQQKEHVLLLIYRPVVLARLLKRPLAQKILASCNYPKQASLEELLAFLHQRMQAGEEFPHEIGLFWVIPREMWQDLSNTRGRNSVIAASGRFMTTKRLYDDCFSAMTIAFDRLVRD